MGLSNVTHTSPQVPTEFHRDVVIGDFTRHFIPFYQFEVQCNTEVAYNSVFVFTEVFGSQQQLTVKVLSSLSSSVFPLSTD